LMRSQALMRQNRDKEVNADLPTLPQSEFSRWRVSDAHATHSPMGDVLGADHHRHHSPSWGIAFHQSQESGVASP
jgi:hypothetical protein